MYRKLLVPLIYRWTRFRGKRVLDGFSRCSARCAETQRGVLIRKIRAAEETAYGRLYSFSSISSIGGFRDRVPIVDYSAISRFTERIVRGERNVLFPSDERLLMFAMTSGSTASPKYIPVTEGYFRDLERGNFIWGSSMLRDHPSAIAHKILHIVSPSRESETSSGVPCGAATGLVAESQRFIARLKYALPQSVFAIGDHEAKYYCILRIAMQQKISLAIAANPSTLVALGSCMEKNSESLIRDLKDGTISHGGEIGGAAMKILSRAAERREKTAALLSKICEKNGGIAPRDVWPELRVIGCWTGGTLTPYLDLVKHYWGEKPLRDPGLIASEGRMTIPIEDGDRGGVLDIQSHFYEFIPWGENVSSRDTLLAHQLEVGGKYYIILTTSSGLFRYNISDVVMVTGRLGDTPVLKFLHKGGRISSLTGEKISEDQVVGAFRACEDALGFAVPQFTACPGWDLPPFYYLLLEERDVGAFSGDGGKARRSSLAVLFDEGLKELNMEYRSKRDSGRLGPPRVRIIHDGAFERARREHIRKSGGRWEQYKHPYLSPLLDHWKLFPEAGGGS